MSKMNRRNAQICYMCGKPATSREHVPPICLFPEKKDVKTSVFRQNLLTVPSCDLHNSKKSNDDEFLMACITGIVGNNAIGYFHLHSKVKRALSRQGNLLEKLMTNPQFKDFKNEEGIVFPVIIGQPDTKRLENCFLHIGYGLYFHKFGDVFDGECTMIMDFVVYENQVTEKYKELCRKLFELDQSASKREGDNPDIFSYKFLGPDQFDLISLIITFYGGTNVFLAFKNKSAKESFDLTSSLINSGISTVVRLDDGTIIEFNK